MEICIYCGEKSQALDHVIPRFYVSGSWRRSRTAGGEPGFKVPACNQCNSILGDKIFKNLVERKEYIFKRLQVKLKKDFSTAYLTKAELAKYGRNLRSMLEIAEARAQIAEDRLNYAAGPPESRWLDMELRWRQKMQKEALDAVLLPHRPHLEDI
jgi:hypothetical protein